MTEQVEARQGNTRRLTVMRVAVWVLAVPLAVASAGFAVRVLMSVPSSEPDALIPILATAVALGCALVFAGYSIASTLLVLPRPLVWVAIACVVVLVAIAATLVAGVAFVLITSSLESNPVNPGFHPESPLVPLLPLAAAGALAVTAPAIVLTVLTILIQRILRGRAQAG